MCALMANNKKQTEARSIEAAGKGKGFDALIAFSEIDGKVGSLLPQRALCREYYVISHALTGSERRDMNRRGNAHLRVVADKDGKYILQRIAPIIIYVHRQRQRMLGRERYFRCRLGYLHVLDI